MLVIMFKLCEVSRMHVRQHCDLTLSQSNVAFLTMSMPPLSWEWVGKGLEGKSRASPDRDETYARALEIQEARLGGTDVLHSPAYRWDEYKAKHCTSSTSTGNSQISGNRVFLHITPIQYEDLHTPYKADMAPVYGWVWIATVLGRRTGNHKEHSSSRNLI